MKESAHRNETAAIGGEEQDDKMVIHNHHQHVPLGRISLTLSRHFSPIVHRLWLVFRATSRILTSSCCMYVCMYGRPAFARPYVGVHKSTITYELVLASPAVSCMSEVRLTWIVFVMGGRWPYSWCLGGCYRQDLFNIARSILV